MKVLVWLGAARHPISDADRAALALARSLEGAALVVGAIDDGAAPSALAEAGRGAAQIVRIEDAGRLGDDPFAAGAALARLAQRLEVDAVIAGDGADAEALGLLPAVAAQALGGLGPSPWPYLARVEAIAPAPDGARALVATARVAGRRRGLLVPLPAVLCASPLALGRDAAAPGEANAPAVGGVVPGELGISAPAEARPPEWLGALVRAEGKPKAVDGVAALVPRPPDGRPRS